MDELPIAAPRERADAARNRERIVASARRLFAERGVADVSLEEIARDAGVGKATLFRRFGDRQALFLALLDEHERELQERLLSGPPPLGPHDDPRERLHAFADALLDLSLAHRDLLLGSETARPLARLGTGAYGVWHRHASVLLARARPEADADVLAHVLLAAFDAELLTALGDAGVPSSRVREALHDVIARLAAPGRA